MKFSRGKLGHAWSPEAILDGHLSSYQVTTITELIGDHRSVDGILNINKSLGMTSHDVVARIRKIVQQKRVGHTGTLDPAASGVLAICVGQATRVAEYLSESGKAYQAEITFGSVTDTYDAEGIVIRSATAEEVDALTRSRIEDALHSFLGVQMQMPPRYSAIKIQGQPAYKRARAGEEVIMEPRTVEMYQLQIVAWQSPQLTLAIDCSKGTYIRSLAYDLGELLGCGAHLTRLVRTRSGPFSLAESITLEQLAIAVEQQNITPHLFPADYALQQYPALHLDATTSERVMHGNPFPTPPEESIDTGVELARIYTPDGRFLAIATWDGPQQLWQPKKVLL